MTMSGINHLFDGYDRSKSIRYMGDETRRVLGRATSHTHQKNLAGIVDGGNRAVHPFPHRAFARARCWHDAQASDDDFIVFLDVRRPNSVRPD